MTGDHVSSSGSRKFSDKIKAIENEQAKMTAEFEKVMGETRQIRPQQVSRYYLLLDLKSCVAPVNSCLPITVHMFLRKNLTIKSHDCGKEGHLCNCNGISNHLPLSRVAPLVGQLSQ